MSNWYLEQHFLGGKESLGIYCILEAIGTTDGHFSHKSYPKSHLVIQKWAFGRGSIH